MAAGYFVTGTDTGVGKTAVAAALIRREAERGLRAAGLKPVASGCDATPDGWRNDDALRLVQAASVPLPYDTVNPYAFAPPIAPHVAARQRGTRLSLDKLIEVYQQVDKISDVVVVEGAGGWRVPIGPDRYLSDLPEALGLGVILVVGLRLGCLNHAVLTAEAVLRGGRCPFVGWVGNGIDPGFACLEENLEALRERLPGRCLGVVPPLPTTSPEAVMPWLTEPLENASR